MALFVINEWLWADSSGEMGSDRQQQALKLTSKLAESDHQIVIIGGSRFDQKAWAVCKSGNANVKRLVTLFVTNIRQNSDRCLLLHPEAVADLPNELASCINIDDHYLIRAQLSVAGSVLVTTDTSLRDAAMKAGLPCLLREEFLGQYFGL